MAASSTRISAMSSAGAAVRTAFICRLCPLPMADDPGQACEHEEPARAAREEEQGAPARSAADLVGGGLLKVVVHAVADGSRGRARRGKPDAPHDNRSHQRPA